MRRRLRRRVGGGPGRSGDEGGIGLLGLGLSVCVCMLLTGGVSVGTAQIARVDIMSAADHASAAAADRLTLESLYTGGVDHATLNKDDVAAEVRRVLAATPLPPHVNSWSVTRVDVRGRWLTVDVVAVVEPPVIGPAMKVLGAPIHVHVTSAADAHVHREE